MADNAIYDLAPVPFQCHFLTPPPSSLCPSPTGPLGLPCAQETLSCLRNLEFLPAWEIFLIL